MRPKKAGALIALDLASYEVVQGSKDILNGIIKNDVDILIANEDEAAAYTGISEEMKALEKMSEHVKIAVLKVGARGSFISHQGDVIQITADGHARKGNLGDRIEASQSADIKDTTGAGDLWAAGFLTALPMDIQWSRAVASVQPADLKCVRLWGRRFQKRDGSASKR